MNKNDLVKEFAEKTGCTNVMSGEYIDTILDTIVETVASNEPVKLTGFGTFELIHKAEREGRNPQTGETLTIAAKDVPKFKPGKAFKDAVSK